VARRWAKVNKSMRQKYTRFEGKRRDWSGVGLKSDCQGVSSMGRDQEKEQRAGANSTGWPAARTRRQEMVTRTLEVTGGHLQQSDVLGGREQLAGLHQALASSSNSWPGWQAKLQFPGESAAAHYSAHVKAVCQGQATVWLVVSVLQEFSSTALAAVFPIAEA